jgi:hypothetical protein
MAVWKFLLFRNLRAVYFAHRILARIPFLHPVHCRFYTQRPPLKPFSLSRPSRARHEPRAADGNCGTSTVRARSIQVDPFQIQIG